MQGRLSLLAIWRKRYQYSVHLLAKTLNSTCADVARSNIPNCQARCLKLVNRRGNSRCNISFWTTSSFPPSAQRNPHTRVSCTVSRIASRLRRRRYSEQLKGLCSVPRGSSGLAPNGALLDARRFEGPGSAPLYSGEGVLCKQQCRKLEPGNLLQCNCRGAAQDRTRICWLFIKA